MAERGKLVVIEGTDGSGKGTQFANLTDYCEEIGVKYQVIDFPRYTTFWGREVASYLNGDWGKLHQVHPHAAANPFIMDRVDAAPIIRTWLDSGDLVIANRYATSNRAYMAAKLPVEQRAEFQNWLREAEYKVMGIPQEDLVLLMNVTPDISHRNVEKKDAREYTRGKKRDIHEGDLDFQQTVLEVYLELAKTEPHWRIVQCMDGNQMLSKKEITEKVVRLLEVENILPKQS